MQKQYHRFLQISVKYYCLKETLYLGERSTKWIGIRYDELESNEKNNMKVGCLLFRFRGIFSNHSNRGEFEDFCFFKFYLASFSFHFGI